MMKDPVNMAALVGVLFVVAGTLIALNPALYVRLHHLLMPSDYYANSPQWREQMQSGMARTAGLAFVGFGLLIVMVVILKTTL